MKPLIIAAAFALAVAAIPLEQKLEAIAERAGDSAIVLLPLLDISNHVQHHWEAVRGFVRTCGRGDDNSKRTELKALLPPYTQLTMCHRGKRGDCESMQIGVEDVVLKQRVNHNLKLKIGQMLLQNKDQLAGSIGVILTDIPCLKYSLYPDLQDILNANFTEVVKSLDGFDFHMDLLFLDDDEHQRNHVPCAPVRKHHDNAPRNSHFHVDYADYGKLGALGQTLCDKDF